MSQIQHIFIFLYPQKGKAKGDQIFSKVAMAHLAPPWRRPCSKGILSTMLLMPALKFQSPALSLIDFISLAHSSSFPMLVKLPQQHEPLASRLSFVWTKSTSVSSMNSLFHLYPDQNAIINLTSLVVDLLSFCFQPPHLYLNSNYYLVLFYNVHLNFFSSKIL